MWVGLNIIPKGMATSDLDGVHFRLLSVKGCLQGTSTMMSFYENKMELSIEVWKGLAVYPLKDRQWSLFIREDGRQGKAKTNGEIRIEKHGERNKG